MAATRTRYQENKRAVEEKYMGPLIKTVMTRCIQCTRCVRFITEVAGISEIGLISRGEDVEITTYLDQAVVSELSANVIDLCPVGALTSKPYAFNARLVGAEQDRERRCDGRSRRAIRVDARGPAVLRVLPRINDAVNEEWISDKTRYACDGLSRQRLDRPMSARAGELAPGDLGRGLRGGRRQASRGAAPDRIGVIAGDLQDAESMKAALDLFGGLGVTNLDCRQDGSSSGGPRESWLFNSTIAGLEAGRRRAADRDQSAPGGARVQRPPAQAVAGRQGTHRRDRRAGRPDLRLRLSGRGRGSA